MNAPTQVLPVDPVHPDPAAIAMAAAALHAGQLVAFPTETVYGLGANALDVAAVARIFAAKERPASDPLIVHIADAGQVDEVAHEVPRLARELAARFWPGPLTLVLPRGPRIPPNVSAGRATVAVRVPRHPVALALLRAARLPVAAPSANRFARPSPTAAAHVLEDLAGRVEIVLDGGPTPIGVESTVVDLTGAEPRLLRPGGIPLEALQALAPGLAYAPRYLAPDADETPAAPGMLLKHYSPSAEVLLFVGPPAAARARMEQAVRERIAAGQRVGVLAPEEEAPAFARLGAAVESLGPRDELEAAASRLFGGLRALDAQGVAAILVRAPERAGLGLAIWDRLFRATEGRVIEVNGG